jgi:hypothetical protein
MTGTSPTYDRMSKLYQCFETLETLTMPVGLTSSPAEAALIMWKAEPSPRPVHAPPATRVGSGARRSKSAGTTTPERAAPMNA